MICDKCDRDNREDANFCDNCGQSLAHISGREAVGADVDSSADPGAISEATTEEQLSRILGGRYELKEMLGRGGMGVVYRAYDQQLGMEIAIKFLLDRFVNEPAAVASLKREAKAAMRLAHPNLLRLYNFEDTPDAKYLLMEFIDGESLASIGQRKPKKKFDEEEVKKYMAEVCDGLSYAHGEGIVHRDIKPSNIMITGEGHVKLADFGLAHFRETAEGQYNLGGGTPIYMSPEQIIELEVTGSSDIYSVGVTMYHMLTGAPPFSGDDVRHSHLHVTPKPMKGVSDWMNTVVLKCLRKEPDGRWVNVGELRDVLKGKKEIGVSMTGSYKPEWMRARDEDAPVPPPGARSPQEEKEPQEPRKARTPATPTPAPPKRGGPRTPQRARVPVHKDTRIRSSGLHERIGRIEKHSDIARSKFEPEGGRAIWGLLAGLIAGVTLTLIDRSFGQSIPDGALFQISWTVYGVMMGIAVGAAKRRVSVGLVSVALGLMGGVTALFLLQFLGGLESLRDVDSVYFSVPCGITLGAFLGITGGLDEKSLVYSLRGLAWAALGSAIGVAIFLGARYLFFAFWRPFLDWIVVGGLLGFFVNFLVSFANKPTASGESPRT